MAEVSHRSEQHKQKKWPTLLVLGISILSILIVLTSWAFPNPVAAGGLQLTEPSSEDSISPLIFGTNLGLFDAYDQVVTSSPTRQLLQAIHVKIIRMPLRANLSESLEVSAAQAIKNIGAAPLLILHGATSTNPMVSNAQMIQDMNNIFGYSPVYYEYGNENDLQGVSVASYTSSWNQNVPQLKRLAFNGQFIGPVNFQYNRAYLSSFLQQANPHPDAVSWHEYTCDNSQPESHCLAGISNWTTHITDARNAMQSTIGSSFPIMITEWNYAPNAVANDPKSNDSNFINTWTTDALQTLASNQIFASMQYSATNTAMTLIDSSNQLTAQGQAFKNTYESLNAQQSTPQPSLTPSPSLTPVNPSPTSQPTQTATPIVTPSPAPTLTPTQTPVITPSPIPQSSIYSFEDGALDGWRSTGAPFLNLQNTTTRAEDGTHSLQVSFSGLTKSKFPSLSVSLPAAGVPPLLAGQTLSAYVYVTGTSLVSSVTFVMDNNYQWQQATPSKIQKNTWNHLTLTVPDAIKKPIIQLGLQFSGTSDLPVSGTIYLDAVSWQ